MGRKLNFIALLAFVLMTVFGSGLAAPDAEWSDVLEAHPGDVAWMVVASAFVLLMTPGLAFFYGGMVDRKNVISTMLQSFVALGVISIIWVVFGFSLCFGNSIGGIIGNPLTFLNFSGVGADPHPRIGSSIPFLLFALFQLKFAIITPALITGSMAGRIRFRSYILFMVLFSVFIYAPLAHMTWHPDGLLMNLGVLDFAGGTVVHMSAGFAALAGAVGGSFSRIQFTSDLLPADIMGGNVLDPSSGRFEFREGPLFANVVLADEINRTTPRTQSALFEAMAEGQVTADGETRLLPRPFLVVATQNPFDFHGTYALPDSQLNRFLMRLHVGYPDRDAERSVLQSSGRSRPVVRPVLGPDEVEGLIDAAASVHVSTEVEEYVLDLARSTRHDARLLRGVSTRGALALYRAIRAHALAQGRGFAIPEDVQRLAVPVLAHRVLPRSGGGPGGDGGHEAIRALLDELPAPQ